VALRAGWDFHREWAVDSFDFDFSSKRGINH
jgi:hypothetical protein